MMRNKLLGWLLLLPLLLTAWGGFQYWRMSDEIHMYDRVMENKAELQQMIAADPQAEITFDDGETVKAGEQLAHLNRELAKYHQELTLIVLRAAVGKVTIGTGLLSLLSGGLAIWLCISSGRQARKSRDQLLKVFARCRRLLPFLLTGQMTLFGLCIISIMVYEALWFGGNFSMNGGGAKVMIFILFSILAIAWYILKGLFRLRKNFAIFNSSPSDVIGQTVSREDAPGLWAWIDEIAANVGTTPPDNIIAGMTECFYVTSHAINLNENQLIEGKTLYFPLIYAALLDREEATAVIGHEMGHFTGEDTTYSLNFAPIYAGMSHSISLIAEEVNDSYSRVMMSPSIWTGIFFLEQFDFAVSHWSRIREFEADKAGARASSPAAVSTSLLRISAVSEVITEVLNDLGEGTLQTDDLLPVVMQRLRDNGVPEAAPYLSEATSHPSDSHPQTRARIEALDHPVDDALLATASREVQSDDYAHIADLFSDAKGLSMALTTSLSGVVREYNTQRTKQMEDILREAAAEDEVVLAEGRRGFRVIFVITALIIAGITAAMVTIGIDDFMAQGFYHVYWLAVPFVILSVMFRNRGKAPLMAFRFGRLESDNLAQPYPLHYIVDYDIVDMNGAGTLKLHLADGAPAPVMAGKNRMFRFDSKKQQLMIVITRPCRWQGPSLSMPELSELIHSQLQTAHARHELRQD